MPPLRSPHRRRAFTLVEMLVVIAIIGILAAILIPAVQAAITKARNAAIVAEISQLEMSVEKYKDVADYPPNFFENYETVRNAASPAAAWSQTVLFRHLKRVSRNFSDPMYTWTYNGSFLLGDPNPDGTEPTQIDAAETLVFWLGGLSKSATSPAAGANHGPLIVDPSTGAVAIRPIVERENAYFEFKSAQLIDADGDGIPEYAPVYGQGVPYVYFDGRSYDNLGTTDNNPMNNIADDDDWAQYPPPGSSSPYSDMIQQAGVVKPYVFGAAAAGADTVPLYVNDKKFQIISAGLDGRYGAPGAFSGPGTPARKLFYTDPNQTGLAFTYYGTPALYAKEDLDNIANFSGAVLGDRSPE